ncbi:MAG: DoxX family protein [Kineosporiaceae bacterium]
MQILDTWREHVIAFVRAAVGLLFVCHGAASLFGVLGGSYPSGGAVPAGTWPGWYAAVIQLVAGGLVMVGLFTRWAALLCSGSMAYAYFVEHQKDALFPIQNGGEAAAMFSLAFLVIAFVGAGSLALDTLLERRRGGAVTGRPIDVRESRSRSVGATR